MYVTQRGHILNLCVEMYISLDSMRYTQVETLPHSENTASLNSIDTQAYAGVFSVV